KWARATVATTSVILKRVRAPGLRHSRTPRNKPPWFFTRAIRVATLRDAVSAAITMQVTRRDLLKLLVVAGSAGISPRQLAADDGGRHLLEFEPLGNVTLLHMTDPHATLLPVFYREPDTL